MSLFEGWGAEKTVDLLSSTGAIIDALTNLAAKQGAKKRAQVDLVLTRPNEPLLLPFLR